MSSRKAAGIGVSEHSVAVWRGRVGAEVKLHPFSVSDSDGRHWSSWRRCCFTPRGKNQVDLDILEIRKISYCYHSILLNWRHTAEDRNVRKESYLALRASVLRSFTNSRYRSNNNNNKVFHSDNSVDRSIRIVWQLEEVFEPCRMMHKQVKEGTDWTRHHNFSAQNRNLLKNTKIFFWGGGGGQPDFRFAQGGRKASDDCILFSVIDLFLGISNSCNYAVTPVG